MPKTPNTAPQTTKDEAALARAQARHEAAAIAASERSLSKTQKGRPIWDKGRTRKLFDLYKNEGNLAAREQIILSNMGLVNFLASKYTKNKNNEGIKDDLLQVGKVGLIKAVDGFDPNRGFEFTTYASQTIHGEIKRYFRDKAWAVKVTRSLQELSDKVKKSEDRLTAELQRLPTTEEIAEDLNVSVDEVLEAKDAGKSYSSSSFDMPDAENENSTSIENKYPQYDKNLSDLELSDTIKNAMKDLTPREQEIIRLSYGEQLSQVEIAERLGVSQVQVSRLLRRTLRKLQEKINPEELNS